MDWSSLKSAITGIENTLVIQVFFVVLVTMIVALITKRVLRRLLDRLEKTTNNWDDAVINAMQRPLTALIWIVGIAFAAQIVERKADTAIFSAVTPLRDIGVITVIAWFFTRLVTNVEENILASWAADGKKIDRTTADAIARLLRVSVVITALLVGLQTLGFSISGVLAFGGIGGIAIGFAAKDLLSNFFGGLMLYLDRPFSIGDWVRSPDRDIEGTVEEIGWRLTRIRTFDKRPVYIPNSVFATICVENPSRMSHRRIYETIGIRYDDADKMAAILEDVRKILKSDSDLDTTQTLMVNFNRFAASSLDFFIYTFTRTTVWTEYHQIKERLLLEIYAIIAAHGAEVAFPTSTVHLPDGVLVESEAVHSS